MGDGVVRETFGPRLNCPSVPAIPSRRAGVGVLIWVVEIKTGVVKQRVPLGLWREMKRFVAG